MRNHDPALFEDRKVEDLLSSEFCTCSHMLPICHKKTSRKELVCCAFPCVIFSNIVSVHIKQYMVIYKRTIYVFCFYVWWKTTSEL